MLLLSSALMMMCELLKNLSGTESEKLCDAAIYEHDVRCDGALYQPIIIYMFTCSLINKTKVDQCDIHETL